MERPMRAENGRMGTASKEWWNTPRGLTLNRTELDRRASVNATRNCSIDGCNLAYRSRGYCWKHLQEVAASGVTLPDGRRRDQRPAREDTPCFAQGCERASRTKGLCNRHYLRVWVHGSLELPAKLSKAEVLEAGIQSRNGCWIWGGPVSTSGYGRIGAEYTHRIAYEMHVGPIPEGMQIDHLCFEKLCANPAHLEAVTQAENLRRQRLRMSRREDGTWEKAS